MAYLFEVQRDTQNRRFYKKNFNPWDFRVSDCVARAISAATLMKYEFVCAYGADDENQVWDMSRTCKFLGACDPDKLIAVMPEKYFDPPEKIDSRPTLNEFIDSMEKQKRFGIYIADVGMKGYNHSCHVVCVVIKKTGSYFIDTEDTGDMLVYQIYRAVKQVPKNDLRRLDLRTFLKPGAWKKRFREVFFDIAQEWETTTDLERKAELADNMEFLTSGEVFDLDDPDSIDMDAKLGNDLLQKKQEIFKN